MTRGPADLVLALGNDLLGDDAAGPLAARTLASRYRDRVAIVESGEAGLALLELIEGRRRVLILDSIRSGAFPPGTVREMAPESFRGVLAPSPHYAGLPEVLALGRRLGSEMPGELRVLSIEVEDPFTIREALSPAVASAMPRFVEAAAGILDDWLAASAGR